VYGSSTWQGSDGTSCKVKLQVMVKSLYLTKCQEMKTCLLLNSLGPTQPPIHLVPGALYLGIKRPGREADHSPAPSAEVKE
jgi:hypothetical protein